MDKFFDKNFKDHISKDMYNIYKVLAENLGDYIIINNLEKEKMLKEDFNNRLCFKTRLIIDNIKVEKSLFTFILNINTLIMCR